MTTKPGKRAITNLATYLSLSCVLGMAGCAPASAPDTRAADEAAIRKADAEWVQAAKSLKVDAWMAFYTDEAAVLPPNDKMATSKESIRKAVSDLLGLPGLSISWTPAKVEVSRSGDLAYAYGAYDLSWTNGGKTATDHGKNVEIWKKQPDGGWKCIVDTWNSDLPLAPPTS